MFQSCFPVLLISLISDTASSMSVASLISLILFSSCIALTSFDWIWFLSSSYVITNLNLSASCFAFSFKFCQTYVLVNSWIWISLTSLFLTVPPLHHLCISIGLQHSCPLIIFVTYNICLVFSSTTWRAFLGLCSPAPESSTAQIFSSGVCPSAVNFPHIQHLSSGLFYRSLWMSYFNPSLW